MLRTHSSWTSLKVMLYNFSGSNNLYLMAFRGMMTTKSGPIEANFFFSNVNFFDSSDVITSYDIFLKILSFSIIHSIKNSIEKFINKKSHYHIRFIENSIEKLIKK